MHISHSGEDDNLKRLLSFSLAFVKDKCGDFNISGETNLDIRAKELVFERTRYAYNDAVEYFDDNFLSDIVGLSLDILFIQEVETDEGI
ncbi:phage gp6-like head-tail connector protein [Oceanobacillus jordanicus]|uniref:Phage gp6-like head-tail connector protein n=1 Tax=Oceanobacillus jordanicus TaxID=2867266 RepID=A0AAW5B3L0_9BACI|nr:phage gp6-like head-tail connector protein [Oceanobacillus jordanicus]MCG3418971.1 phage gp6-like head-tail connector protein [Oceanobacillus jordanicus]